MDITNFMSWFVSQVVNIFTYTFTTLNNITFGGTSLLKLIVFINVIVPFLYIIITIPMGAGTIGADKVRGTVKKARTYNAKVQNNNIVRQLQANYPGEFDDLDIYNDI